MFNNFKSSKHNHKAIYDPFLDREPFIQSLTGSYLMDTITAILVAVALFGFFFGGAA